MGKRTKDSLLSFIYGLRYSPVRYYLGQNHLLAIAIFMWGALSIAASYDGKNWKEIIKLEDHDKGEYSYPAIIQGNDGKIYISYTYNRELIRFAVLEVTE